MYGYMLLHFHASISISASIITAEVLYPAKTHEPWISGKTFSVVLGLFMLWIPAGLMFTQYFPNVLLYISAWLAIGLCLKVATMLPTIVAWDSSRTTPPPFTLYCISTINTIVLFVGIFSLPRYINISFPLVVGGLLMFDILSMYLIVTFTNNGERWTDTHKLALVSGLITFFLLFGISKDLKENFSGSSIVSMLTILLIMNAFRKIKGRVNVP